MHKMVQSVHYQQVDPGIRWVKDADVAIDSDGPLDANRTLTPNVIKIAEGYRMYYHGFGPQRPHAASQGYILSAFSTDAEKWQKEPGVRIDAGGEGAEHYIWSPDVIPLPDGGYRMYVEGRTEQAEGGSRARLSVRHPLTVWSGKRSPAFAWAAKIRHMARQDASISTRTKTASAIASTPVPPPIRVALCVRVNSIITISSVQYPPTACSSSWSRASAFPRKERSNHSPSMRRKRCA